MNAASNAIPEVEPVPDALPEDDFVPQWGDDAPKGGRTVLGRILKDGAKVPLFLGQSLVNSLRDMGYNSTTSALCEHVDNAIQWGATEVRVYLHQTGKKGDYKTAALVYDNGCGMAPHVLKAATAFGGSMVFGNRGGIGRYGVGMKAAALSMSPVLEVYSWQEPSAFYSMTLDVEAVGSNRANLIELDDPTLNDQLPPEIVDILTRPMGFPKNPEESQVLLATTREELAQTLGESGTIVFMPECDRLSSKKAQTLVEYAVKEMGRIYRRFIAKGVAIYVNNRLVEAFDPTYWMTEARHARVEGVTVTRSRLVGSWTISAPVAEGARDTTPIQVRLFALPYDEWGSLPRKTLKNDLHVFEDHTVSFMRNDREVEIGSEPKLKVRRHHTNNWLRLEVDFDGAADEGFGVAVNKQGVRLKEYVSELIVDQIGEELATLRQTIKEAQARRAALRSESKVSEAERRATDAEVYQGKPLPELTDEERAALDENLRSLVVAIKRQDETDEDAFERVKTSRYVTVYNHDQYWPFYHCDFKYGKVILKVNTAHPFFLKVWQPLSELATSTEVARESGDESVELSADVAGTCKEVLVGIQTLLFSLARTQSQMCSHDGGNEHRQVFDKLRREWSENLATQLNAK